MSNTNTTRKEFIRVVGEKAVANRQALTFGALGERFGLPVRNEAGVQYTFSNIYDIANNQYDNHGANDTLAGALLTNFSAAGYADVSSVTTMGAIDVTIKILAKSLVPHVAVDRALADPHAVIYFMNLVATNNVNGVKAGDKVVDNFAPIESPSLFTQTIKDEIEKAEIAADKVTLNLSTLIVPGKVHVRFVKFGTKPDSFTGTDEEWAQYCKDRNYEPAEEVVHGYDYNSDGKLVIGGLAVTGTVSYKGTDGSAGEVVLESKAGYDMTEWDVIVVEADEDAMSITDANTDGDAQLTLKPVWEHIELTTKPKIINLQQNIHANSVIQKVQARAALLGATANYTSLAFQRITSLYMEDVNQDCIKSIVAIAHHPDNADVGVAFLDLSSYNGGMLNARNETVEHLVFRFFTSMVADFLCRTGMQPTVCITGTRGAMELRSNLSKFVPSEQWASVQNGHCGSYDSIPVFRHLIIDRLEERQYKADAKDVATFYLATKMLDNNCGTLVLGEFLPLTQLQTTSNFQNLTQIASGFFSQIGITPIQNKLVKKGLISYTANITEGK